MRKGATWQYTTAGETMKQTITDVTGDNTNATAKVQFEFGQGLTWDSEWTCTPDGVVSYDLTNFQMPGGTGANAQFKMTGQSGTSLLPPEKMIPGTTWDSTYTMEMSMDVGSGQSFNIS